MLQKQLFQYSPERFYVIKAGFKILFDTRARNSLGVSCNKHPYLPFNIVVINKHIYKNCVTFLKMKIMTLSVKALLKDD